MILESIKKFIFPSRCIVCDETLPFGFNLENEYLCDNCRNKLEFIKEPTCKKCGAMINSNKEMYCVRCETRLWDGFEWGFGLLRYNDFVKESMHRIKYLRRKEYIDFYGKCIAKVYKNKFKDINADCLVPVPIHSSRLNERSFNQAEILAKSISNELSNFHIDLPVNTDLIIRTKNTKVLNKLDDADRNKELKDAFSIRDASSIDRVIIVDDIYTTGSTINEIAKALKDKGVDKVYFVCITIVDNL